MSMYNNILGGNGNNRNDSRNSWDRMVAIRNVWANEQSAYEAKRSNDLKAAELRQQADLADPDGSKRKEIAARRAREERERQEKKQAWETAIQCKKIDVEVDNAIKAQQKAGHLNAKIAEVKYDILGFFKKK